MSRIVVLGGGESGVGAAVLAKVKGFDVFLSDNGEIAGHYADDLRKWDIPFEQGGHTEDLILNVVVCVLLSVLLELLSYVSLILVNGLKLG